MTVKLENISATSNLESLSTRILSEMDINLIGYCKSFEFECKDGITIHVEAKYSGFSYRTIELLEVYMTDEKDELNLTDSEDALFNILQDKIVITNCNAEESYYAEKEHRDYIMFGLYY